MKKIALSSLLFAFAVMNFAQRPARPVNSSIRSSEPNSRALDQGTGGCDACPGGGPTVPIDHYEFLLLGIAVLLIAYFIYKRRSQFV